MRKTIWIPNPIRREVNIKSKGVCFYCGLKASKALIDKWNILRYRDEHGVPFEIDHKKPVREGGTTVPSNLVVTCRRCNRSRLKATINSHHAMREIVTEINGSTVY